MVSRRRSNVWVAVLGVVLGLVLAFVASVGLYVLSIIRLRNYDDIGETIPLETNLERLDVPDNMRAGMRIPVPNDKGIRTILIIGSDTRDPKSHGRSDAMMLLTINDKTKSFHLTSLMRGIYVSIPDDPDPAYRPYWSSRYMLNAAHTWGGPRLLMKTIQRNFRVHVTQYVATDFSGFKDAIDTVGGVTIHLSEKEAKHLRGKGFGALTAGDNLLDGEAALAYARIRKIDSDFRRMERQRKVMLSLFDKMTKSNPAKLTESAKALMPCITTNMTDGEILGEIVNFYQYRTYSVDQLFLPLETYDAKVTIRGMEMYDIDWEKNIRALHEFMRK